MARRQYGSGSVTLRSDGRWEGRIRLPDGSRQFLYGRDRRQLVTRLQEERWRIAAGIQRVAGELVFPNLLGNPLESSSVTDALKVALERAGLPRIRVHDLRHTSATVLLEAGVHPKLVQELLGHSTVALTLNTYSHVTAGLSGEAARTIDRVLRLPTVSHKR